MLLRVIISIHIYLTDGGTPALLHRISIFPPRMVSAWVHISDQSYFDVTSHLTKQTLMRIHSWLLSNAITTPNIKILTFPLQQQIPCTAPSPRRSRHLPWCRQCTPWRPRRRDTAQRRNQCLGPLQSRWPSCPLPGTASWRLEPSPLTAGSLSRISPLSNLVRIEIREVSKSWEKS